MSSAPVIVKPKNLAVTIISGSERVGEKQYFHKPIITFGRDESCDVCIKSDPKISRMHVEISQENGLTTIRNISGKNYVLINGKKVDSLILDKSCVMQIGDTQIQIGTNIASIIQHSQNSLQQVAPVGKNSSMPAHAAGRALSGHQGQQAMQGQQNFQRQQPQGFRQAPPPPPTGGYAPAPSQSSINPKIIIAVVILIGAAFFMSQNEPTSDNPAPPKVLDEIRSEEDVRIDVEKAEAAIKNLNQSIEKKGQNTVQYQTAQSLYVKGFRDYRLGQYERAIYSLQAALDVYPNHELARQYLILSRRKLEEHANYFVETGKKYRAIGNWRMCESNFRSAMILWKDPSSLNYIEAKKYLEECVLKGKGKY